MKLFLIFWVIPSLCILLWFLESNRALYKAIPERFTHKEWEGILLMSVLWPVALIIILCGVVRSNKFFRFIIKERKLPWR